MNLMNGEKSTDEFSRKLKKDIHYYTHTAEWRHVMDLQMKIDDEKYMTEVATRKKTQKESAIKVIKSLIAKDLNRKMILSIVKSSFGSDISEPRINKLVDKYMK